MRSIEWRRCLREYPMTNHFIKEIVSGGQTGVDRAALDIAIEFEISHSGWCPYERKAEDGIISTKYNLKEAPKPTLEENLDPDAIYKKRTELNVMDSDGTLIIVKDTPIGGTLYTVKMAEKHKKPYLIFNFSDNQKITDITNWIIKNDVHKLNVAGPRASQTSGIYNSTYNILHQFLNRSYANNKREAEYELMSTNNIKYTIYHPTVFCKHSPAKTANGVIK
jgi:putative molybdenum carrier protein